MHHNKIWIYSGLLGFILWVNACLVQAKNFKVSHQITWVKQVPNLPVGAIEITYNSMQVNAQPGDTFELLAGKRNSLRFDALLGDSLHPILICNKDAQVHITMPAQGFVGISLQMCKYIKISGCSNPNIKYGIKISHIPTGSGINVSHFSSHVEIEGIEISEVFAAGIVIKTDPSCANYSQFLAFTMYQIKIHHNYLHQIGNEGMYIGNTFYNEGAGKRLQCEDASHTVPLFPHKIIGVEVYENTIDSTGWDGIQLASCYAAIVRDNVVSNDSYLDVLNQTSGILIGEPTQAMVYNNTLLHSMGTAIQCLGVGTALYNNLILYPGKSLKSRGNFNAQNQWVDAQFTYGIYVNDKVCKDTTVPRLPNVVAHNTIVIDKVYAVGAPYYSWAPQGINANAMAYINGSFFGNNLVVIDTNFLSVEPIKFQGIYESNELPGYDYTVHPSFISLNNKSAFGCNYFSNEVKALRFTKLAAQQFTLHANSLAVDAADARVLITYPFLAKDKLGKRRPQGKAPDFGAYEK